ncbi:MAG: secondary thiamine-phosphate synthase enzyme YjbQ [candidate division Zixibacteria bacterium]|nr:secondary thiamine-phosphate synthase enzyme YjbQ [candidate division Zixibacteria bacterium]
MTGSFTVSTSSRCQLIDITSDIQDAIGESKVKDGIVVAFIAHTTAGITINENADPDVKHDMLMHLEKLVPQSREFHHAEGNSDSHIKASMMGSSVTIILSDGRMNLGTWQGIYFCEFDGPRTRKVWIKIIEG